MSDQRERYTIVSPGWEPQVILAGVRGRPGPTVVSAGVDSDGRLVITLDDGTHVITDPINRPWGSIQGDITDQSDLMDLLADKVDGGTFEQFQQGMTQALAEKLAIDVYNQFVLDVADALAGKVGDDDPRLTDARAPTGGAGGVLAGQYPNPGFAVDMATQAELDAVADAKVDKVAGKQLSTEDYTTAEKSKLAGIEAGAQVNAVTSVAGKTGAVTLVKDDVGLGNVDNTRDADKPVSTAQQEALDGKVDKVAGKGLSTNDFTDPLRDKLIGIEAGATANSTDAYLLNRANHTGTQAISTVTGLQDELDAIDGLIGDIGSALDAINGEVI